MFAALLKKHFATNQSGGSHDRKEIFDKLTKYCERSVHDISDDEVDHLKWDFYNSFYYAYTVVSTIGELNSHLHLIKKNLVEMIKNKSLRES